MKLLRFLVEKSPYSSPGHLVPPALLEFDFLRLAPELCPWFVFHLGDDFVHYADCRSLQVQVLKEFEDGIS